MLIAHRIALAPNNVQATYLARAAGVARFAYSWALSEWQRQYVARQADPALPAPSQLALRRQLNAIKREQYPWMLEVTIKGSRNRDRAKRRLARLHARIANLRRDGLHKLTTSVARRFHTIGIEDLNVKGMLKNHRLARAIADMGFYELRRQLEYKAAWRGGHVVVVDRWYPSSKTCSCCGYRLEELALGTRSWICPACGVDHDRDVNAAVNLKNMAMSSIATACGGNGTGPAREYGTKPVPAKQKPSGKS